MIYLLLISIGVIIASNFYIFNFQGSLEGNDERGKIVQLQMTKIMYNVLFLGLILILVVNAINLISNQLAVEIIFWLILLNSLTGAIFLYYKKMRKR
jgi:hypothetical protein